MGTGVSPTTVTLRLPPLYKHQQIFLDWTEKFPRAQALVAPCGTKVGKSFGASAWMVKEAWMYPGLFCVWIAPTYLKAKIGYRYMKAMLPECEWVQCLDGLLEIRLANGSFIKFLHGKDAETTVEGEAVDRFVIDEAGKTNKQVWLSLFTTLTQTQGYGIITGTPRGFNWYWDVFKRAKAGDPFFCWIQLRTELSPFVKKAAIIKARRLLPKALFDQYYLALFVSAGTVFGDLSGIWDESIELPDGKIRFWVHPDEEQRKIDTTHGVDLGKMDDFTVFFSVNSMGNLVGYTRFRHCPYTMAVRRFKYYLERFFPETDNLMRFDATGVGEAVGDIFLEEDIDCAITPVVFTNKSKQEMVSRTIMAIESNWLSSPRIPEFEHEMASYELSVTKSGLHSYSAADGEHDDIVSASLLAISNAFQSAVAEEAEKMLEQALSGNIDSEPGETDHIQDWADEATSDDGFFDQDSDPESDEEFFNLEDA